MYRLTHSWQYGTTAGRGIYPLERKYLKDLMTAFFNRLHHHRKTYYNKDARLEVKRNWANVQFIFTWLNGRYTEIFTIDFVI